MNTDSAINGAGDDRLQEVLQELSELYFDGRLSGHKVLAVDSLPGQADGFTDGKARVIRIWSGTTTLEETLLHEMAHAITNEYHGPKFRSELRRIQKLGAQIDPLDLRPPEKLTSSLVQDAAEDALTDRPSLTLEEFATWLVHQSCPRCSGASLLDRNPWITKVWTETRERLERYGILKMAARREAAHRQGS